MSDAIISAVLTQLFSIIEGKVRSELNLVVGLDKEVKNATQTFASIRAVIADAERRQVKDKESEGIKLWLQRLQDAAYDMDDVLSEWSNSLLKIEIESSSNPKKNKVRYYISLPRFYFSRVVSRRAVAVKIRDINSILARIATDKDRYNFIPTDVDGIGGRQVRPQTTSYVDVRRVQGRDRDRDTLVAELLKKGSQGSGSRTYHTISLVGTGGIGKTTLAKLAYNCEEVTDHFDTRVWICVSEPPFDDELRIAMSIVEQLQGSAPNLLNLEPVLGRLSSFIEGKKFLIVLDDVWTEDFRKWKSLRSSLNSAAPGSKVLVTTRKDRVAQVLDSSILPLGELTEEDCWLLFSQIAFHGRNERDKQRLEDVGRRIAKKCKGLPLAAEIIGNFVRFKDSVEDWNSVWESDIWELEARKDIFPPLLLSYNDLPSPVKNCFLYCANFPQDYEIEADNLIKLWMAQDYLGSKENVDMEMEAIGKEYLETLVMRSFFQRNEKDKGRDNVSRFKMHDMVLQLAQYLRKGETIVKEANSGLRLTNNSDDVKARHLTLIRSEDSPFPESIGNTESLHSFWVQSFYDSPPIVSHNDEIPPELLQHLVHLKSLDLSRNRLRYLPREIEKLQNLRFLNLSHNPLSELPEIVCDLYRLQTLKLVACNQLSRLPQKISKLRNLRHLEIDRTDTLSRLPKGIGKLSSLRTLSKFVLTGSGDSSEDKICTIGDFGSLNQLRGSIKIQGLGYVVNATDAEKAELKKKKHLTDLHMDFHPQSQAQGPHGRVDVAEALELHPDLQTLHISFYEGARFPSWMTSLSKLRKLRLEDCPNCTSLPPLGTLPSLENLCIEKLQGLKLLGAEFSGWPGLDGGLVMFPELKKLKFSGLNDLEKWSITMEGSSEDGRLRIMPKLQYLKISECRKLKALPDSLLSQASLKKLDINNCPLLKQRYQKKTGEHWMKISRISRVRIL